MKMVVNNVGIHLIKHWLTNYLRPGDTGCVRLEKKAAADRRAALKPHSVTGWNENPLAEICRGEIHRAAIVVGG
jgi:hypothetical protein